VLPLEKLEYTIKTQTLEVNGERAYSIVGPDFYQQQPISISYNKNTLDENRAFGLSIHFRFE
jgi:hypothetical protein